VAAIASILFFVVALQGDQFFVAAFLAVFAGALLGFLHYNFAPARLFMGDAGSLFVGFLLGSLTVGCTYYEGRGSLYAVCMPVLILGVPLFDTASVLWIRWRRGAPLWVGDTNHFSHRLVRLGMTRREAVLTIYLLALILGGTATLLRQLNAFGALTILLVALGIIALIVLLENAATRRERGEEGQGRETASPHSRPPGPEAQEG
jgi:UDP-GlcNAc:undecaprenyl-phosphate/decaprenyl-phosphate GlcNAc-1-phosphate transferase